MCPAHVLFASTNSFASGSIFADHRINPVWNHAGLIQRDPALNGNLPEVLIERHHDARFGFGRVQENYIAPSGAIRPGPKDIVADGAKPLHDWLRKVFVREDTHLRWNRISLVCVARLARPAFYP